MDDPIELVKCLLISYAEKQGYYTKEVEKISTGGANCSSYTFKATLSAPEKEDLKLFIKVTGLSRSSLKDIILHAFQTELFFYTNLLQEYRKLENKHKLELKHKLRVPKLYENSDKIFVLEDLKSKGYEIFDRIKSLTWDEVRASFRQLAKLHALSVVYIKEHPEKIKLTKQKLILEDKENFYRDYINSVKGKVIEAANDIDKERVSAFIENVLKCRKFNDVLIKKKFIIHRDFKPSNLMYKINVSPYKKT